MKLDSKAVEHLMTLCRLALREDELKKFQNQMTNILEYVDILNEVDTENVLPTAQVTGLKNVTAPDEVSACENPEELLKASPLPMKNRQITVPSVF